MYFWLIEKSVSLIRGKIRKHTVSTFLGYDTGRSGFRVKYPRSKLEDSSFTVWVLELKVTEVYWRRFWFHDL